MSTSDLPTQLQARTAALTTRPVAPGLAVDPFTGSDVVAKPWIFGSSSGTSLGLTARGTVAPSQDGLPGLETAIDADGQGTLRLTGALANESSFVIYNRPIDRGQGLSITFDFFSYGGSGADGIGFFLIDGNAAPSTVGAIGGALGYAQRTGDNVNPGLLGGYLGIGFDAYGNFSNPTEGRVGGPGFRPDTIAVRGSQANNYQYLTGTESLSGGLDLPGSAATRAAARRTARIDLSPTGKLNVQIDLNADGDFLDADETPSALQNYDVIAANGTLPDTFKFGFAASTGGLTNIHEIRNLSVGGSGQLINNLSSASYVVADPPLILAPNLTISELTGGITSATVFITNYQPGQDFLSIAGQPLTATSGTIGALTWTFNPATSELGFDGVGTAEQYQSALRQVTYRNDSDTTNTETRNVRFRLDSLPGGPGNEVPVQVAITAPPEPLLSADILLRDSQTNSVVAWYLQGATLVESNQVISSLEPNWAIVDSKDFDGDGITDILLRNDTSGEVLIWYMENDGTLKPNSGYVLSPNTPPSQASETTSIKFLDGWQLAGAANIDSDAQQELVWQNLTLDRYLFWEVDPTNNNFVSSDFFRTSTGDILQTGSVASAWKIVGLSDFTLDGQADVLLRSEVLDQSAVWSFSIDSTTSQLRQGTGTGYLPGVGNNLLQIGATADFTGDGRADVLWHSVSEDITILWTIAANPDGSLSATSSILPLTERADWILAGANDYGGGATGPDGTADIVWRNKNSEEITLWFMREGQLADWSYIKLEDGSVAKAGGSTWDVEQANQFGTGTAANV